jgi:uncharacterized protein YutE (UPF0331/DUF86 family)
MDDIILNKSATIERCLQRINEEYIGSENEFKRNFTKQDSIILNIQRACEAAIDMASHVIRIKSLGVPQTSRDVFTLLEDAKVIPADVSQKLQAMVGFRNIAVHNYTKLNLEIVESVINNDLSVFLTLTQLLLQDTNGSATAP